jgi:hypothetical protein
MRGREEGEMEERERDGVAIGNKAEQGDYCVQEGEGEIEG